MEVLDEHILPIYHRMQGGCHPIDPPPLTVGAYPVLLLAQRQLVSVRCHNPLLLQTSSSGHIKVDVPSVETGCRFVLLPSSH